MAWSSFLRVLFPCSCVGCGAWDEVLCAQCWACILGGGRRASSANLTYSLHGMWRIFTLGTQVSGVGKGAEYAARSAVEQYHHASEGSAGEYAADGSLVDLARVADIQVPHWALGEYSGVLRHVVLAAKHRADIKLEYALVSMGEELGRRVAGSVVSSAWGERGVCVVPAPSRMRRRFCGREVALPLAVGVARGLVEGGVPAARVQESLRLRWGSGTQAGRSGGERRRGRVGAMECVVPVADEVVVFVDDIVTTGATIREMARALGCVPDALVSLCWVSGAES